MNGRPILLFDVARWQFTLFGKLFLPSDTVLLAVGLLGVLVGLFLATAVLGRVWCGWACPQTVYMEFLYRPIERFFDGPPGRGGKIGRKATLPRTIAKYFSYLAISLVLAHIFLSYFVGVESLRIWMSRSPMEHPTSFLIVVFTTLLMLANFAWFREQTCVVACPYGRLQSVLVDRDSLVIRYDNHRGEPRGHLRKTASRGRNDKTAGDCVDCGLCVETCPTGIDIREGVRMECIACAQCIDACDAVMDTIHKPRGLIRYSSQRRLDETLFSSVPAVRLLRPRTIIYTVILAGIFTVFVLLASRSKDTEVVMLRGLGVPFTELPNGEIANPARIRIANRTREPHDYAIEVAKGGPVRVILDENYMRAAADSSITRGLVLIAPVNAFRDGRHDIQLRLRAGGRIVADVAYQMLGPHQTFPSGKKP
jgi:cytochrome c oxidase accessory protein FixG